MIDLSTNYLGLKLKNPLIASSSGLTNSVKDIKEMEESGIAAVVVKSIFEEEIMAELNQSIHETNRPGTLYPEIYDFFDIADMEDSTSKYLKLISDLKASVSIPVIGSVNCVSANEWTNFATRIQEAGADALELNMFILPSDLERTPADFTNVYFDVIQEVKKVVEIPVALKISYFFSNLGQSIVNLSESGVDGLVLFNRFYNPDIDINKMEVIPADLYSRPEEVSLPLRWIGMLSPVVSCDLAASTGVHSGEAAIKLLLSGANAVQIASVLYKKGIKSIQTILSDIEKWMQSNGYNTIDEFRGKLSSKGVSNPAVYERYQFMKHFAGK